jgi:hypothetical protein
LIRILLQAIFFHLLNHIMMNGKKGRLHPSALPAGFDQPNL